MMESPEAAEEAMPELVQLQLASQSITEFMSRVRERFAKLLSRGNIALKPHTIALRCYSFYGRYRIYLKMKLID